MWGYLFLVLSWFEKFITLVILFNCIIMALENPSADCANNLHCDSTQRLAFTCEYIFIAIFSSEALLKIIGMGFLFGPKTYLRDGWNVLDFFVVLISWTSLIPSVNNFQVLRTLRLFRVLRSITHIPPIRKVISALIRALPLLMDVLLLVIFILLVFAILGLHLFRGSLRRYCTATDGAFPDDIDLVHCSRASGGFDCDSNPERALNVCTKFDSISANPEFGIVNYDNFGYSFLTVFQLTSKEGWTDVLYATMDATSGWSVIFYLVVIWIGALIALGIAFAALESSWSEVEQTGGNEKSETLGELYDRVMTKFCVLLPPWMDISVSSIGTFSKTVVDSFYFQQLIMYTIVVNTIILGLVRADMSDDEAKALGE